MSSMEMTGCVRPLKLTGEARCMWGVFNALLKPPISLLMQTLPTSSCLTAEAITLDGFC